MTTAATSTPPTTTTLYRPPARPTASREMLTAGQVADMLSISPRTVWRMLERGELPEPVRFNRKLVRWHQPTMLRFLDEMAARHVVDGYIINR